MNNSLIYGKDTTPRIVGAEVHNNSLVLFKADGNKTVTEKRPYYDYVLLEEYDMSRECGRLGGKNDFQYFVKFDDKQEMYQYCKNLEYQGKNFWRCYNQVESAMLREGFTYYKDMQINDVSVMSFDIETIGVTIDENSYVYLISNTFRNRDGSVVRKLFAYDDYDNPTDFINAWCKWFRQCDPDVVVGHNIYGFDFPYLDNFARLYKTKLKLGRNASAVKIDRNPRKFRRDGSQDYDYKNVHIFGREIVDTFFLSIKYDVTRKYPSYKLKGIIAFEGLEKDGRQHWDFNDLEMKSVLMHGALSPHWEQFKQYAVDDADDALALFDLMAPQFFYYGQSIPKAFQEIINTATGSQVNSFMLRAYLQDSQAIPMPSERAEYEGAISFGNPGIYQNVYKIDVASLYPSIMMQYNITDTKKDPNNLFIKAVEFFTKQRLEDKRLAKETGKRVYNDLSNGRKIMINSFYGFMGATGLNFNYPAGAAEVTRRGREILQTAIDHANEWHLKIVNADTDSISYCDPTNALNNQLFLASINKLFPEKIIWEDDGFYDSVVVVKAKNYALKQGDKVKIKGSGLKATMKELALARFLEDAIDALLNNDVYTVKSLYWSLAWAINSGDINIDMWSKKVTITKSVLNPKRTNEERILAAIGNKPVQEGDKLRVFFKTKTDLELAEKYNGIYCKKTLFGKLYKTVKILEPVLDLSDFPNFALKRHEKDIPNEY